MNSGIGDLQILSSESAQVKISAVRVVGFGIPDGKTSATEDILYRGNSCWRAFSVFIADRPNFLRCRLAAVCRADPVKSLC